jgi:hypothetical protein
MHPPPAQERYGYGLNIPARRPECNETPKFFDDPACLPDANFERDRLLRVPSHFWRKALAGGSCTIRWGPHAGRSFLLAGTGHPRMLVWRSIPPTVRRRSGRVV